MPHSLESLIQKVWPANTWSKTTLLVGVSGGTDSTALLHALCRVCAESRNQATIVVAHFNHQLRGDESNEDADFVASLANRLDCQLVTDSWSRTENASEDTARRARYAFFETSARQLGARCVVLAHTADDQVETVLHRIIRGTGVSGLAGIPSSRLLALDLSIVRPLLGVRRSEITSYLSAIDEPFRSDSSNAQTIYTRNRLRNDLLPKLRADYNSRVDEALLKLAQIAGDTSEVIAELAAAWLNEYRLPESASHRLVLACKQPTPPHRLVVCEGLKRWFREQHWPETGMNYDRWCELATLWSSPVDGSITLPGNISAEKRGERLTVVRPD